MAAEPALPWDVLLAVWAAVPFHAKIQCIDDVMDSGGVSKEDPAAPSDRERMSRLRLISSRFDQAAPSSHPHAYSLLTHGAVQFILKRHAQEPILLIDELQRLICVKQTRSLTVDLDGFKGALSEVSNVLEFLGTLTSLRHLRVHVEEHMLPDIVCFVSPKMSLVELEVVVETCSSSTPKQLTHRGHFDKRDVQLAPLHRLRSLKLVCPVRSRFDSCNVWGIRFSLPTQLEELKLRGLRVLDDLKMGELRNLTSLDLEGMDRPWGTFNFNNKDSTFAFKLNHLTKLKKLAISSFWLGQEGVREIVECGLVAQLDELALDYTGLDDVAVLELADNHKLIKLSLRGNSFGNFADLALDRNTSLQHLDIGCNRCDARGFLSQMELLAQHISSNTGLKTLSLASSNLDNDNMRTFVLNGNDTLESIDLSESELTDEGMRAIGLDTCSKLRRIDLRFSESISEAFREEIRQRGCEVVWATSCVEGQAVWTHTLTR